MEALKAELVALDRMESALAEGPLLAPAHPAPTSLLHRVVDASRKRRRIEGGIKSLVMQVLNGLPVDGGMTAQEILVSLRVMFGTDLPRTSLSPQLSRLRQDLLVRVDAGRWYATPKGREAYPLPPR